MGNNRMEEFSVMLIRETEQATQVDHGAGICWLPKSQIVFDGETEEGAFTDIEVPQWLAEEKGLC